MIASGKREESGRTQDDGAGFDAEMPGPLPGPPAQSLRSLTALAAVAAVLQGRPRPLRDRGRLFDAAQLKLER